MKTIKVRINPDGVTCTEVNPLGEKEPILIKEYNTEHWAAIRDLQNISYKEWQKIESKLRTFDIESIMINGTIFYQFETFEEFWICRVEPGSIKKVLIISEGKVRII